MHACFRGGVWGARCSRLADSVIPSLHIPTLCDAHQSPVDLGDNHGVHILKSDSFFPPHACPNPTQSFFLPPPPLQVTAQDKASGKVQKITITSDKGRLSEAEIERMVREAEENAEQDKQAKVRREILSLLFFLLRARLNLPQL